MKRYLYCIPLGAWLLYFSFTFSRDTQVLVKRLEAINLSREYTVGGFHSMMNVTAYFVFLDDAILLILAIALAKYLRSKMNTILKK